MGRDLLSWQPQVSFPQLEAIESEMRLGPDGSSAVAAEPPGSGQKLRVHPWLIPKTHKAIRLLIAGPQGDYSEFRGSQPGSLKVHKKG
ncbi:hypothetical protein NDU88_000622 [Pleurodeles waltl]|uniref:Uncharacterized protein n=1 Tax=Pleurodeles waltl TaxID=8319 RepID=A0AAV7RAA8_PLEWA|nr:hypothetical protein NDU88_000622 [Pleurodeles waltl]